jgi:hypothetical protein
MNYYNDNNNDTNNAAPNNAAPNNAGVVNDWRLRTLYIDTEHLCAPKTDEVLTSDVLFAQRFGTQHAHPSSVPVILKDTTRPYTYYTMKSYAHAQDNNYYVNFDDHISSGGGGKNEMNKMNDDVDETTSTRAKQTFENFGCVKTYFCTLLGCFTCCLFNFKPF